METKINDKNVLEDDSTKPLPVGAFRLDQRLVDGLKKQGITKFSDIQGKAIPKLLRKQSVLGLSPTGTGKTLAYVLPSLQDLIDHPEATGVRTIVLSPTVALLFQVQEVFRSFFNDLALPPETVRVLKERRDLLKEKTPKILLSTPALLNEARKSLSFKDVQYVILDEGDMVVYDGFFDDLPVLKTFAEKSLVSFFSASLSIAEINRIKKLFRIRDVVDVRELAVTSLTVRHHLVDRRGLEKNEALLLLLSSPLLPSGRRAVFASEKKDVYGLQEFLKKNGVKAYLVTGDLEKREIKQALEAFSKDPYGLLVASDYASRGLDLPDLAAVLSLDLPKDLDYYFHRAGRSGRMGKSGDSYLLYDEDDGKEVQRVLDLIGRKVSFDHFVLSRNGLRASKAPYEFRNLGKKDQSNEKLQKEIRHAVELNKSKKVKPNYKKKVAKAVDRVKEKHRMKVVLTNLAKSGKNARDFHVEEEPWKRPKKKRK